MTGDLVVGSLSPRSQGPLNPVDVLLDKIAIMAQDGCLKLRGADARADGSLIDIVDLKNNPSRMGWRGASGAARACVPACM